MCGPCPVARRGSGSAATPDDAVTAPAIAGRRLPRARQGTGRAVMSGILTQRPGRSKAPAKRRGSCRSLLPGGASLPRGGRPLRPGGCGNRPRPVRRTPPAGKEDSHRLAGLPRDSGRRILQRGTESQKRFSDSGGWGSPHAVAGSILTAWGRRWRGLKCLKRLELGRSDRTGARILTPWGHGAGHLPPSGKDDGLPALPSRESGSDRVSSESPAPGR